MEVTSNALYSNAFLKFKCKISCIALCEPQPGQSNPVIYLKGHFGKNWLFSGLLT